MISSKRHMQYLGLLAAVWVSITVLTLTVRADESATSTVVPKEQARGDADPEIYFNMDYAYIGLLVFLVGLFVFGFLANFSVRKHLSQENREALAKMPAGRRVRRAMGYCKQHARRWYVPLMFCWAGFVITGLALPVVIVFDMIRNFARLSP